MTSLAASNPIVRPATAPPGRVRVFIIILLFQPFIQLDYLTYALDADRVAKALGVGLSGIATLTSIPAMTALCLLVPSGWLADRIGFRPMALAACFLLVAGALVRLVMPSYYGLVAAQILVAAAGPILGGSGGPFLRRWFRPHEIVWASMLPQAFLYGGLLLSFVLVPRLYAVLGFWPGLRVLSTALIVFGTGSALLLPRDPPDPKPRAPGATLAQQFSFLRHPAWLNIAAIFFFGDLFFDSLVAWVGTMLQAQGYTPTDAGGIGAALIAGGMAGILTLPPLAVRSGRPRLVMIAANLPIGFAVLSLVHPMSMGAHVAAALVIGFASAAGGPLLVSWTARFAGPDLGKALSSYSMVMAAGGAAGTRLLPLFVHGNDWTHAAWVLVIWLLLPTPLLVWLRIPPEQAA